MTILFTFLLLLYLSPRRFELLQVPHQETILPLNYKLDLFIFGLDFFYIVYYKDPALAKPRIS